MWIKAWLSELSSALFYPVSFLLLATAAWVLVCAGLMARAWFERTRGRRAARSRYLRQIDELARTLSPADLDIALEEAVQSARADATRSLNAIRFAIRAGPSLGLMGTLIPMAAALNGLAQGDLPSLAGNMVIAFSSTVVGIAVGLAAYVVTLTREAWVRSDLDAIRFHAERVLRTAETPA